MTSVLTARTGAVLTITLNRPEVLNAFDRDLHERLRGALDEAASPDVRAVVLTGAGRGFCVGQDLNDFEGGKDVAKRLRKRYHPITLGLRALEKPVLAVVNGVAAGAGLSLALACDLRIASDEALFVPAFIGLGLVPDAGGTWFAARILGPARAFEWLTSGRRLTAAEALQWGIVSEVVPHAELEARTAVLAARLATLPTRAVWQTRRLLDSAVTSSLEDQLEREAETQAQLVASPDFAEGVAAFLEKREPRFTGRS